MHRSTPLSQTDGRAIIASYDLRRSAQCLSLHLSQRIVAVGALGDVKLVKIEPYTCTVSEISTLSHSQQQVHVNDLAWCPQENAQHRLAVCYSNGDIKVFSLNDKSAMATGASASSVGISSPSISSTSSSSSTAAMMAYATKTPGQNPLHVEWFADRTDNNNIGAASVASRVCWHPTEPFMLFTAHNDGSIKQFHTSPLPASPGPSNKAVRVFKTKHRNQVKDIKFNPFNADIFADCTDSGCLRIWDRKVTDTRQQPIMMTTTVMHKGRVNALAWCPYKDSVIATGATDKTVKVWDTSKCTMTHSGSSSNSASTSQYSHFPSFSSNATNIANVQQTVNSIPEPELMCTINAQGEVSRILWGLAEDNSAYLLTLNSDTYGYISFWSEDRDKRNVPVCILKGHNTETASAFDWIEISAYFDALPEQRGKLPSTAFLSSIDSNNSVDQRNRGVPSKQRGSIRPAATRSSFSAGSSDGATGGSSHGRDNARSSTQNQAQPQSLFKSIISTARDGKLLIQNPRFGYMPYNHMTTTLMAISNQGHCAYQRGSMKRVKELSFPALNQQQVAMNNLSLDTSANETREAADPSMSPIPMNSSNGFSNMRNERGKDEVEREPELQVGTGRIMIGLADFKDLQEARGVRSIRGGAAEGSVFDPALIYLLARNYSLAYTGAKKVNSQSAVESQPPSVPDLQGLLEDAEPNPDSLLDDANNRASSNSIDYPNGLSSEESMAIAKKRAHSVAMAACQHNFNVASEAGLRCRASVWASIMALLPDPAQSSSVAAKTQGSFMTGELPFTQSLLADLLAELLEGGDSQHFVVVSEVLRSVDMLHIIYNLAGITTLRARRIYLAYIDLLKKLQLFCEANEIIKASDDDYIATLSKREVEIQVKCSSCRKEVPKRLAEGSSGVVWCQICKRSASNCALCLQPVTGLLQWCPICAHGGHLSCMQTWFRQYSCCPTGCNHDCCFSSTVHDLRSEEEKEKQGFVMRDGVEESLQTRRKELKNVRKRQLQKIIHMFD